MSLPAASLTGVVSMATVEEEAPLFGLSGLKLRRDLDTRSGLRSPAATDKGDLEIDVSVAAVPSSIVLQSRTDRRVWTTAVDSPYGGGLKKYIFYRRFWIGRVNRVCPIGPKRQIRIRVHLTASHSFADAAPLSALCCRKTSVLAEAR